MPRVNSRKAIWGVACVALLCSVGLGAQPALANHKLPHFTGSFYSQQASKGLDKPIGMAIAPDGRMFFADDAGVVKTKAAGIGGKATPLFNLSDHVNMQQDRGLISVAVDKNYTFNRHIYIAYTFEDRTPAEIAGTPSLKNLPKTQRLVRVTVPMVIPPADEPIKLEPEDTNGESDDNETVVLGGYSSDSDEPGVPFSETQACPQPANLVSGDWGTANATDCIPSDSVEHTIDSVRVDPSDGTLWVSVGDGATGGSTVDPRAWRSQREESYSGKLLHVDSSGNGLSGHPFCPSESDLTKTCTKVHAKGFRNPYRFFLRPEPDGRPVVSDAGWSSREELDLVQAGKNYGWPCREGDIPTPTWSGRPECTALPPATFTEPLYSYDQIENGAVIGGITYEGNGSSSDYPGEYKGAIFFGDYGSEEVWYLRLDNAGTGVAPGYPKLFADDITAVDWATAPNGDLMYVDIGFGTSDQAQATQISFDPSNAPPQAVASADKTFGPTPLEVQFDGSGSSDPNGDKLTYSWDLDGDGETDSSEVEPSETYEDSENVTVTLEVDDGKGHQNSAAIELFPGDEPPDPSFTAGPTTYTNGTDLLFEGAATDPDEALGPSDLSWDVRLDHAGTHIHALEDVKGDDSVQVTTDTVHDAPSTYIVRLTATDSRGLSVSETRILHPETSLVRIESTPSGAPITYGGEDKVTPYEKQSTIGLISTTSAASEFLQGGSLFSFDGWLDGAPQIRDLLVTEQDVTLTARYRGAPPPPPPDDKDKAKERDRTAPRLSFKVKGGLVNGRRAMLKGVAQDPSGIRRVEVGLRLAQLQGGRCWWWSRSDGDLAKQATSCGRPAFMQAQLKGSGARVPWVLPLKGRLPAGRYRLVFRTTDRAGNVSRAPGGSQGIALRVADAS